MVESTSARVLRLKDGKAVPSKTEGIRDNKVTTSKYSCVTFLPLNLWEQLHKLGNVYFLLISLVMWIGEKQTFFVGPMKAFSTYSVLFMMMSITAIMALIDDRQRAAADKEINTKGARVVVGGKAVDNSKLWQEVKVGDAIVVRQDEDMPADMVIIYASGEDGNCYVSTANLDGESNLKQKCASTSTQAALTKSGSSEASILRSFDALEGQIEAEPPTTSIYDFSGRLTLQGEFRADDSLSGKQLLLRGTVLRNTAWCLGIVVYTGSQTRMVMNSRPAPLKRSNIERITNKAMVCILATQAILALASDCLFMLHKDEFRSYWYLIPADIWLPDGIGYWLTFFVLYSNLMPISLYPTMEAINAAQAYFIKNDKKMCYTEFEPYFPARVRSTNLCQEIGQVSYIFSDKTGTLTQNVMELKRLSIAGRTYGENIPDLVGFSAVGEVHQARLREATRKGIDDFLEVLAVGHTVMAARDGAGNIRYEAESPDEGALVNATARLGWAFQGRSGQTATVTISLGDRQDQRSYTVLAVNAFDSTRKRMSVLVNTGRETILLAKGADNVMLERADRQSVHPQLNAHLSMFAREGLRTLVLGRRVLSSQEADAFRREYEAAERSLKDRDELLARAAEKVEVNLEIVGATAIEDKLQDGVGDCIEHIKMAGIKLWVLTGDKLETARNIGFSTRVLSDDMLIEVLDEQHDIESSLDEAFQRVRRVKPEGGEPQQTAGLMITGAALRRITGDEGMEERLLELAELCEVVIACRVSPLQKALMVRLVRSGVTPTPVTLSVGDGANDVPMIQEAQVGVGIAGREGRQAVNNSDFAIGQFKYLKRLLLLHGRWNYRRACKCTLFTFWRNAVQVLMINYYTYCNGYSGTSLFEDGIRITFNPLCSLPIVMTGVFDQDVGELTSLAHPELYEVGIKNKDLDTRKTVYTLIAAFLHSMILLWVTFFAFPAMDVKNAGDYYTFGTACYTCLMVDMSYRVLFLNATHNFYTTGSIVLSLVCYALTLVVYPGTRLFSDVLEPNMYGVTATMFKTPIFWVCVIAVPVVAISMDVFVTYLFHRKFPDDRDKVWEKDRIGSEDFDGEDGTEGGMNESHPLFFCVDPETGSDEAISVGEDDIDYSGCISTSDFAQQRLRNWRCRITASRVIFTLVISFVLLTVLGVILCVASRMASQVRIHYYEPPYEKRNYRSMDITPLGTAEEEVVTPPECQARSEGGDKFNCTASFLVPEHMNPPILVYYAVGNLYQNFNDYLKSTVAKELEGEIVDPSIREAKCKGSTRIDANGDEIVPCGMMATSLFNDTFSIDGIDIISEDLAWGSDLERYQNPPDYGERPGTTWLYEMFPGVIPRDEGVKNERFVIWMRPSATWRVWNLYGWIHEEIQAGQNLTVQINSHYPTESLGAYKHLVLTEVNAFGARHSLLGIVLVLSGFLCALGAIFVCLLDKVWTDVCAPES